MKKWLCGLLMATGLLGSNVHADDIMTDDDYLEITELYKKRIGADSLVYEVTRVACEKADKFWVGNSANVQVRSLYSVLLFEHGELTEEGKQIAFAFSDVEQESIHKFVDFDKYVDSYAKTLGDTIAIKVKKGMARKKAGEAVCVDTLESYFFNIKEKFKRNINDCKACQKLYK